MNFISNEHWMNIDYISAGNRMGSGWAVAKQQLSIDCLTAENRMTVLMKNDEFSFDSQRLSNRCLIIIQSLFIYYLFNIYSLLIRFSIIYINLFLQNLMKVFRNNILIKKIISPVNIAL